MKASKIINSLLLLMVLFAITLCVSGIPYAFGWEEPDIRYFLCIFMDIVMITVTIALPLFLLVEDHIFKDVNYPPPKGGELRVLPSTPSLA